MKPMNNQKRPRSNNNNNNNNRNNNNRRPNNGQHDARARGNMHQMLERYLTMAREASSSGDRIAAENYYQHAEHYYRVLNSMQPKRPQHQPHFSENEAAENTAQGEMSEEGEIASYEPEETGVSEEGEPQRINGE